jgi:hypothetical protein
MIFREQGRTIALPGLIFLAALVGSNLQLTAPAQAQASVDTPPPGQAGVYVLRPVALAGAGGKYYITLDGHRRGYLANGQFFWDYVPPGPHVISISDFSSIASRFTAETGKNYSFEVSFQPLKVLSPYSVEAVSEDESRKYVRQLSRNTDHQTMHQYIANWPLVREGMTIAQVAKLIYVPTEPRISGEGHFVGMDAEGSRVEFDEGYKQSSYASKDFSYAVVFKNGVLATKVRAPGWPSPP